MAPCERRTGAQPAPGGRVMTERDADGYAEYLDQPPVPSADEAAQHRAQHHAERLTADPHAAGGDGL